MKYQQIMESEKDGFPTHKQIFFLLLIEARLDVLTIVCTYIYGKHIFLTLRIYAAEKKSVKTSAKKKRRVRTYIGLHCEFFTYITYYI